MPDRFDPWEYFLYLRGRWRFIAGICITATVLALAISLALPKRYTATAQIVVEPPAGSDQRAATAVSPIYLESLRTYEHFASSDNLFHRALEHFHLRGDGRRSIESWKRAVLRVEMPRSTKILEISATLPDPRTAHAFALFIAEETVNLNRTVNREGDEELTAEVQKQAAAAKTRLEELEREHQRRAATAPVEGLEEELEFNRRLKSRLDEEIALGGTRGSGSAAALRQQRDEYAARIARNQRILAQRIARREELAAKLKSARDAYDALAARLRDVQGTLGYRGERLKIIDPGIVPERPSFPNTVLNVFAALLLASVIALVYVSVGFSFDRRKGAAPRPALRMAGNAGRN